MERIKRGVDIMDSEEKNKEQEKPKKGIVSTQDNKQFYQEEENKITIMPTMIDDSEMKDERKRSLSSIIPKDTSAPTVKENEMSLTSKEKELKSDGAIVLGSIDDNAEVTYNETAVLPEQINIEERRAEMQKNKNRKRGTKKKVSHKKEHKTQNIGAMIALIAIAIIGGTVYYYFNHPKENDFQPKTVTVELGESLPIRATSYVKPGVGTEVDEMQYEIDKSKVLVDTVGKYTFTVKHNGITKTGTINIVDTTPPELIYKESIRIAEGEEYGPESFIEACIDQSGCNYSFLDASTTKKNTTRGTYYINIVASDAYDNKVTKKVQLIIEAQESIKKYVKKYPFDFNSGYEQEETYELHFTQQAEPVLLDAFYTVIRTYQDATKYKEAREQYIGEAKYTCDDAKMTITQVETYSTIDNGYSRPGDIDEYLKKNGFEERG